MQFVLLFLVFGVLSFASNSLRTDERNKSSDYVPSLLGVITYGYEFGEKESMKRMHYLDIILKSYVTMREAGYFVSASIAAYESEANARWQDHLNTSRYVCATSGTFLPIVVELFPFRELGKDAFGTRGDLAIRHRDIFLREKNNYDYFLVQEDDVKYTLRHVQYYIHALEYLNNTNYYPTFTDYEKTRQQVDVISWRLRNGTILLVHDKPFFTWHYPMPDSGRGYMITSEMLNRIDDEDGWKNPAMVRGEFNPLVATSSWISKYFQKRLVVPLENWYDSLVHHMPNKYIYHKVRDAKFLCTTRSQSVTIFQSCSNNSAYSLANSEVRFSGDDCRICLQGRKQVELKTQVEGNFFNNTVSDDVVAYFSCKEMKTLSLVLTNIVYTRMRELTLVLTCIVVLACGLRSKFF